MKEKCLRGFLICNKLLLGSNKTLQFVKIDARDRTHAPTGRIYLMSFEILKIGR